jgi:hypothetical protein
LQKRKDSLSENKKMKVVKIIDSIRKKVEEELKIIRMFVVKGE